jgi:hypothetical protein
VQAATLIGALTTTRAVGASVSLVDQPNLKTGHIGPLDRSMDQFVQQEIERVLLGYLKQEMAGKVCIEPAIRI